jgi:hypothetical protein
LCNFLHHEAIGDQPEIINDDRQSARTSKEMDYELAIVDGDGLWKTDSCTCFVMFVKLDSAVPSACQLRPMRLI